MNALIPLIMEELVEVINVVLPERISERIREQIVDVHVPRAVEQVTEVAKTKEMSVLAETFEEKMVRVETLAVEVEKMNSELFEATKMKDDLEADTAKHSSLLESAVSRLSLDGEVPSRDRTLQCAAEQIPNVPVPEMVEQLVEVPETISQDRIQQRTVEQIVDFPVPQAVQELAEVCRIFSQDRIQQRTVEQTIPAISLDEKIIEVPMEVSKDRVQRRFAEQTIENSANSVAEMIVEVPVIQTPERTQQVVNTLVQHDVDTVEVEKPKITELTVQRKKPIIQEKINQVTRHIKIPQVQFLTKVDDMPFVVQRQVSTAQTVQKAMEVPPLQFTDKVMNIPVVAQRQIPMEQTVQKTMEIPHLQCVDEVIDVPAEVAVQAPHVHIVGKTVEEPQSQIVENAETPEIQMVRGTETSESLSIAPVCRSTQAEIVEAVEIGAIPPTEFARPIFVTTPVLETPRVQLIDKVVSIPVMAQRQVPSAQKVQKIVEMPKILCCSNRSVPLIMEQIVEAPQIIPREFVLSPREGGMDGNHRLAPQKRKSISECGMTEDEPSENDVCRASASSCEVSCETHGLVQGGESRLEVDETRERHAADKGEGLGLLPVAPNMEAGGSHLQATAEEEQTVDWAQDLREIRRMVEFLVRRERKLDVKADVAVRRLERLEREHSQLEDEEREASLQDALADRTKVVKLVVDKWFVDKGFGFGSRLHPRHRGAEVLTIGTDAWVQVMHDDARAQGVYRARKAWGHAAWKEERD